MIPMLRFEKTLAAVMCAAGICAATSCVDSGFPVYSSHESFGSDGWDTFRALEFTPYPVDSVVDPRGYDLVLCIRYNQRADLATLPLTMEEVAMSGPLSDMPVETEIPVVLFDAYGHPAGAGRHGIYEITDTIRKGIRIPDGYSITFSHTLPVDQTRGLLSVGVMMYPAR